MRLNTFPDGIRYALIMSALLSLSSFLYAQDSRLEQAQDKGSTEREESLTALQKQARIYRSLGLQLQNKGELDQALSFYQKALALDPSYPVVINDLGVIYERQGFNELAKEYFQKAITIDPYYLSAYTNLACLSEKERDLKAAYLYWKKRAELGFSGEYWTEKAKQRVEDIALVLSTALSE
jgi:Tfp pilus assembly protein PilF